MSMDLFLWKAPVTGDSDEARAMLDRYLEQDDKSVFEPSKDVVRALAEIRRRYPDDADGGAEGSSPWASWPIPDSDRLIELSIRWSADDNALDKIIELAAKHDLIVYDPQGPDVYRAREAPQPEQLRKPTAKDFLSVITLFVPIAAATLAAWWFIPWGWLRWPLVAIGLFFTIAAGIVVYATVEAAAVGPDEEPRAS
jgi:hypothetical protein